MTRRTAPSLALAAALLSVLVLPGCGSDAPQDAGGSTSATGELSNEGEGEQVVVPTPEAAEPADVGLLADRSALPAGFPDLPLVDGEVRLADPMDDGGFTALIATDDTDLAGVVAGATLLLTDAGWTVDLERSFPGTTFLDKPGEKVVRLGAYPEVTGTVVNYLIGESLTG